MFPIVQLVYLSLSSEIPVSKYLDEPAVWQSRILLKSRWLNFGMLSDHLDEISIDSLGNAHHN
jgi:hypothetical protein